MRVAVVGAGIAGLAAARVLHDRRHDVRVFERAPIPGGRCATRVITAIELPRGLSGELAFDHGAQYFTVRDDRFSLIAAEWERDRVIGKWTGRIVSFDGEGWEDVEEGTNRYVGTPGMSAIPIAMAKDLAIEYGKKIESIEELGDFDRIIIARPVPEKISMKPRWAVMAAFEERVPARFDAAFVNGSSLSWIARNTSKPKRNYKIDTWALHASTSWSEAHFDDRTE